MYYFIINPEASGGRGRKIWDKVLKYLKRTHNTENYEVYLTEKAGDARRYAQQLSERCPEKRTITVIGGEGTLNEVVDGLHMDGDRVSVAYIPTKTDNDIARCYRKRYTLRAQLKRLRNPSDELLLDYGVLNCATMNRRFAVSSGIGFDAALFPALYAEGYDGAADTKKPFFQRRRVSYFHIFVRELIHARPSHGYVILGGDKRHEFNNILFISAHVHPFDGGYMVCPKADGADGYLDICIVSTKYKWRLLLIMLASIFGKHVTHTGVHLYRCREAVIHTDRALPVHVDGESIGEQTDYTLTCIPKKLRLRL